MNARSLFIGLILSIFVLTGELAANTPPLVNGSVSAMTGAMNGQAESAAVSTQMSANCTVTKACTTQCGLCGLAAEPLSLRRENSSRAENDVRFVYVAGGFGFRIFRPPKGEARLAA